MNDTDGEQFSELLHDSYGQFFRVRRELYRDDSEHQKLVVFENARFGRVLALDGIIQTTEADEFIYHEMLAHVPLLAHGRAREVLIVGGGDGGMLREALKHRAVERVTQVEIDADVITFCKKYLPNHAQGAFDDPRADVIIDDGLNFVSTTERRFDVIISDSTDPVGPGEALFSGGFYAACRRCLNPGGVLVTQNGVAFLQLDEVVTTARRLRPLFADVTFYGASVPTYVGGLMTFAWASDEPALRRTPAAAIAERYAAAGIVTRYYNPPLHAASFALPQYVLDALGADATGADG